MTNQYKNIDDMPLVLTPMDIGGILNISKNRVYEVIHSEGFPVIRVGKQYRIPRDKFLHWLDVTTSVDVA